MFGNYRKIEKRILSVILVMAMTVSLLSGCGQKREEPDIKDTAAWENVKDEAASAGTELAKASQEAEDILDNLDTALEKEDCSGAASVLDELSDQLEDTKDKTEEWLSSQKVLTGVLDDESAGILKEREDSFTKELEQAQEDASELMASIQDALSENDIRSAVSQAEALRSLLTEEETPRTYGTSLPNEVEIPESAEEAYGEESNGSSDSQSVEPVQNKEEGVQAVSETVTDELLATEGDTRLSDAIKEKAEELETPLAIYNYLKNNIGYEYYYGSRKGASGTLDSLGGNDLDQASLLIAMLRHQGYEAEYVKGNILLTEEQALSLTGADTFKQAADVLASAGTPVTRLMRGEEIVYIRMEHVWVRAYLPYTDYRGAGNASGDMVWLDLDTGIKDYEAVTNIYDTLDDEGFSEQIRSITESGDTTELESLLSQWEEKLAAEDLSETYARKRIIKQEEISYLPLSLQYTVEQETGTFTQVADSLKDSISFEINGEVLTSLKASDIQGKNILLTFRPASDSDKTIFDSYSSIFDIPAYAVYMKPVLLVDGEVAAEGEEYLETTLGTKSSFTIHISSGGKSTSVTNDVTTGSMYAVTLDSQSITASEIQSVYDEVAALKDRVTEENVYSEEYLGKLLNLAGKLYFAQVDIADTIASDMYDVAVTRSLSEGITGYEVETAGLYGMVTGISEGSLYIDVDNDSHSVISLEGDSDVTREYFMSTGMLSSLYESTVWEEITGEESVSTISILAKASEENIDILLISTDNLSTEIEKLNTDETTKQSIINAVNSGMIVTVPAEEVTMGDWSGTGYIVTNPATGVGEYMISGGLNGGSVSSKVVIAFLVDTILAVIDFVDAALLCEMVLVLIASGHVVAGVLLYLVILTLAIAAADCILDDCKLMVDYVNGDVEAGKELESRGWISGMITVLTFGTSRITGGFITRCLKKDIGKEATEILLKDYSPKELKNILKTLTDAGIGKDITKEYAEKFGKEGIEWLLSKQEKGLTADYLRLFLDADDINLVSDGIIKSVRNSDGMGADIIKYLKKYGPDIKSAFEEYGDDAVKVLDDFGDDAVGYFRDGASPEEIRNVQKYVAGIVDSSNIVDDTKLNTLKLAIQNGKLKSREIKMISKKMSELGISEIYESKMKTINFKTYLENIKGPAPENMINPHAHHILFKTGNGSEQQELVKEGQAILRKYGIDPIVGEENFVWAPNNISGQHDIIALREVVDALKKADEEGGSYEDIVEVLDLYGRIASQRK